MGQDYDPRIAVVRDLGKFLEDKRDHDIIIGGDFNGAPMEGEVDKEGTVAWLMGEFGLLDAHEELNEGPSPRTYRHGTRRIDQIYVSDRLLVENLVLQTTIGDFDSFFTSDHRPVLIDLDAATYFGADTHKGIPRQVRILNCGDPRLLNSFLKTALARVTSQKLDDKLFDLATRMRAAGHVTEEHEQELNTIDIALTEILLSAEAALKPQPRTNRRGHFSKALDEALWTVVYWRKRVTMLTTNTLQDTLAKAMKRSGQKEDEIRWHPTVGLRKAHRDLDRVKRDLFSKRQSQLEELAEALADENDNTKEMQLKALRNKEKMAADYKAVKSALNSVNDKRGGEDSLA